MSMDITPTTDKARVRNEKSDVLILAEVTKMSMKVDRGWMEDLRV